MPQSSNVTVLNVGQNGQVTIPSRFRREHALTKGGKVIAVRMGQALVMAPHDGVLESICLRLAEAMKSAGEPVEAVKRQAAIERAQIVQKRYGAPVRHAKGKRRRWSSRGFSWTVAS